MRNCVRGGPNGWDLDFCILSSTAAGKVMLLQSSVALASSRYSTQNCASRPSASRRTVLVVKPTYSPACARRFTAETLDFYFFCSDNGCLARFLQRGKSRGMSRTYPRDICARVRVVSRGCTYDSEVAVCTPGVGSPREFACVIALLATL